jgi:hypothetical protein
MGMTASAGLVQRVLFGGKRRFRHPEQPRPDGSESGPVRPVKTFADIARHKPEADKPQLFRHPLKAPQLPRQFSDFGGADLFRKPRHRHRQFAKRARDDLFGCLRSHGPVQQRDGFGILPHPFLWPERQYMSRHVTSRPFVTPKASLHPRPEEKVALIA